MKIILTVCAVCALTAAGTMIFCLVRGTGQERKKLLCTMALLGAAALWCFSGGDLAGRLIFGGVLMVTVYCCMKALERMVTENESRSMAYFFSYVTLALTMVLVPVCVFLSTLSP